jgi:hypothetical protein
MLFATSVFAQDCIVFNEIVRNVEDFAERLGSIVDSTA